MMKGKKQPESEGRPKSASVLATSMAGAKEVEKSVLSAIMENSGAMMAYLDNEFNFLAVNSAYAKGSGHTVENLIDKNHFALFPDRENQAIFTKVRETGEPVTFLDKPFQFPDQPDRGTTYWDWTLGPIKDEEGQVRGLILSLLETTKRKKAEEAAIDSARFPEENPHPVLRISKDGTLIYCNPAGLPMLDDWKCKVGEPVPGEWRELVLDVFTSEKREEFEQEFGNQTFSFFLTPIVRAGYVNAYGRDVTVRKRMEEELRNSLEAARQRELEISALLNASKTIIQSQQFKPAARSIFSSCKDVLGASAGYIALLSRDESKNDVILLDAGEQPCTVDPSLPMPVRGLRAEVYEMGKVAYDNQFSESQWMKFIPDGHVELRNVLFAPLVIGAKTVGIIGLANKPGGFTDHDATMALAFSELASIALINSRNMEELEDKQKRLSDYSQRLEQMVEERTRELQDAQRLAAIGETAGMVGHDIRNPLQSIEGAIYLARESIDSLPTGSEETKELREVVQIIQDQAAYINHVVADLQDFARTPTPQLKDTDIRKLMEEALSSVSIPQNVEIEWNFEVQLPRPMVDPVHMMRVLVNLIENAVQAMPRGGKLTLRALSDGRYARISVGDTGVGIPEANRARIFMPLFTTKAKGQGFGLAVCRKLVRAHNGEIIFESEVGKGSTFIITLPITKKAG